MPDLTQNDIANEERLKAALWYSIGKSVDAMAVEQSINASPQFIGALTELVYTKIAQAATDLEAFAKHCDRSIISTKDVLLLARNNEGLQDVLKRKEQSVRKSSTK